MVRHRNKERKKIAVRQCVSLAKPKTSLQLFCFSSVSSDGPVSTSSSPLFSSSASAALAVVSIIASTHYLPTDLSKGTGQRRVKHYSDKTLFFALYQSHVVESTRKTCNNRQNSLALHEKILKAAPSVSPASSAASTFVVLSLFRLASSESRDFSGQKHETHNERQCILLLGPWPSHRIMTLIIALCVLMRM